MVSLVMVPYVVMKIQLIFLLFWSAVIPSTFSSTNGDSFSDPLLTVNLVGENLYLKLSLSGTLNHLIRVKFSTLVIDGR